MSDLARPTTFGSLRTLTYEKHELRFNLPMTMSQVEDALSYAHAFIEDRREEVPISESSVSVTANERSLIVGWTELVAEFTDTTKEGE